MHWSVTTTVKVPAAVDVESQVAALVAVFAPSKVPVPLPPVARPPWSHRWSERDAGDDLDDHRGNTIRSRLGYDVRCDHDDEDAQ